MPEQPDWWLKLFAPMLPQPLPFDPFIPAFDTVQLQSLSTGNRIINPEYYPTLDTATKLMAKFRAHHIIETSEATPDGAVIAIAGDLADVGKPAVERLLVFSGGTVLKDNYGNFTGYVPREFRIAAGLLADCYVRMPEAQSPPRTMFVGFPPQALMVLSAAEQACWSILRVQSGFPS